jgi:hypothetical protein
MASYLSGVASASTDQVILGHATRLPVNPSYCIR